MIQDKLIITSLVVVADQNEFEASESENSVSSASVERNE